MVIVIGVFVILALGLYGPATLVGPLPAATAAVTGAGGEAAVTGAPALPETGATALVSDASVSVLASAGLTEPVPIGGSAKIITALVVLDAKPLAEGASGESIVVTKADYDSFVTYGSQSARTVPVGQGESWSQREMLQALLLGSSNNHADALARWAFGSVDAYLEVAATWLTDHGLENTTVVDTTGLDEADVGTASDLARLSALAFAYPAIAEIMTAEDARLPGNRSVDNLAGYAAEEGFRGLSRSYTDQAGICYLFALDVAIGADAAEGTGDDATSGSAGDVVTLYGAFLREPDWETVDADLSALAASASGTLRQTPIISAGQSFVTYTTPWGATARGVATRTESRMLWVTSPLEYRVDAKALRTGSKGEQVGSVTVGTPDGDVTVRLELDQRIGDPGPFWRLTNPVPVIEAFIDSRTEG